MQVRASGRRGEGRKGERRVLGAVLLRGQGGEPAQRLVALGQGLGRAGEHGGVPLRDERLVQLREPPYAVLVGGEGRRVVAPGGEFAGERVRAHQRLARFLPGVVGGRVCGVVVVRVSV